MAAAANVVAVAKEVALVWCMPLLICIELFLFGFVSKEKAKVIKKKKKNLTILVTIYFCFFTLQPIFFGEYKDRVFFPSFYKNQLKQSFSVIVSEMYSI